MNRVIGMIVALVLFAASAIAADVSVQVGSGKANVSAVLWNNEIRPAYLGLSYYPSKLRYGVIGVEGDLSIWHIWKKNRTVIYQGNGYPVPIGETYSKTYTSPDQWGVLSGARVRFGDSRWGVGKGRRLWPSLGLGLVYQWAFPQDRGTPHLRWLIMFRASYRITDTGAVFAELEGQTDLTHNTDPPGLSRVYKLGYRFRAF